MVVLATQGVALAAGNPMVTALQQQVKLLRQHESAVVKQISALYDPFIRGGKLADTEVVAVKAALREQREQYLALAATPEQVAEIRAQFGYLQRLLTGKLVVDSSVISELRARKSAQIQMVRTLYKAKIAELNTAIRAASAAGSAAAHTTTRKR
jgi:hypothetical protein